MSRLIEDLLSVSEAEAGRLTLEKQPLALAPLFEEVCGQFENLAHRKRHRLEWTVAPEVADVRADRHRLIQVLSNLVGNAIKFTPDEGVICLRAVRGDDEVVTSVEDTGIGIRPGELPNVFMRFIHTGRARGGGAGLGLAIAKAVVEAHGGRIWVQSEVGLGTTFFFSLPIGAETATPAGKAITTVT